LQGSITSYQFGAQEKRNFFQELKEAIFQSFSRSKLVQADLEGNQSADITRDRKGRDCRNSAPRTTDHDRYTIYHDLYTIREKNRIGKSMRPGSPRYPNSDADSKVVSLFTIAS
jgi:hypothetical protein